MNTRTLSDAIVDVIELGFRHATFTSIAGEEQIDLAANSSSWERPRLPPSPRNKRLRHGVSTWRHRTCAAPHVQSATTGLHQVPMQARVGERSNASVTLKQCHIKNRNGARVHRGLAEPSARAAGLGRSGARWECAACRW